MVRLNMMESKAEFLTTIEDWNLSELLVRCGSAPAVLVAIEVRPRHGRTGLLEERGRWIRRVWNAVLREIPGVAGQRMLWSQLLFICAGDDIQVVESRFAEILRSCRDKDLKSLCVLSVSRCDAEAKPLEIDRMFDAFKEWNQGAPVHFSNWLLDGEKFPA